MKNIFKILFILFPLIVNAEITKEDALKFAEQYNLKDLNTNRANVDYAKKFEDVGNNEIGKKYEYLKSSNINVEKYKELEKINYKKTDNEKKKNYIGTKEKRNRIEIKEEKDEAKILPTEEQKVVYEEGEEIIYVNEEDLKDLEELSKEEKQKKEEKENLITSLKKQSELLEGKGIIKKEIEKLEANNKEYEETQLTFFYFVSSDMEITNFNDFIAGIDKLKDMGYNIVGRVIFRGLINENMDGIQKWMLKSEEEFKLKRTPNVKYQFHPWAFRYFSLEKVPAFALSTCKKDFRFKTCEHKYLVKGKMTFQNFLEILKENNKSYKDLFFDLLEVSK